MNEQLAHGLEHALWLLLIILAVAIVTKYIRLPYMIALVITGLVIALLPDSLTGGLDLPLTSDLILFIFLPALLFEGAYNLNFSQLRADIRTVTVLAIIGVLLTVGLVGTAVHYVIGLDWSIAFLFGAIVAATDPIAVLATFRQLGAPPRLSSIVEGESLFNDGTSLVAFSVILGMMSSGQFSIGAGAGQFILLTGGGLAVGAVLGLACSLLLTRLDDHLVETVITLVLAYGTYIISESLQVSGVMAVVAAGLVVGNYGAPHGMSASTRIAMNYTWDLLGFLANSLLFILIGLQVNLDQLGRYFWSVAAAVVGTLLARAIVVYGLNWLLLKRLGQPLPGAWLAVITWGGLRGALALAMAFSIPAALLPEETRSQLLVMTFGVVIFSLLGQGLSIYPLLRRLGLAAQASTTQLEYERVYARLQGVMAGRRALSQMQAQGTISHEVAARLTAQYQQREQDLHARLEQLQREDSALLVQEQRQTERELLRVERNTMRRLAARGAISPAVQQELVGEVDRQLQGEDTAAIT